MNRVRVFSGALVFRTVSTLRRTEYWRVEEALAVVVKRIHTAACRGPLIEENLTWRGAFEVQ